MGCDNFKTHTKGAAYAAFEPTRVRQLVRRIEFCYTPKHGSWMNIAECELSATTRPSVADRWIGELTGLQAEIAALVNRDQRTPAGSGMAAEGR